MDAVDTNILARFLLRDDEAQTHIARSILEKPVWVSDTVWLELGWVLGRKLKLRRDVVCDMLDAVLAIDTVHVANRDRLIWAVERLRLGADWGDMIHLCTAASAADVFVTFDRAIAPHVDGDDLILVRTLA